LKLNYGSPYNSIDIFIANHDRYDKQQVDQFQNHKPGRTLGERDKDDLVAMGLQGKQNWSLNEDTLTFLIQHSRINRDIS
jgi:hypothetical protein